MNDNRNKRLGGPPYNVINDTHYKLMRVIEANPELSQRQLARELGISLGKINYCLAALVKKGWVKVGNFRSSKDKSAYAYLLTPRGVEEKAAITLAFLRRKMTEYEALKQEIAMLRQEVMVQSMSGDKYSARR